jgi:hypothetical protein
LNSITPQLQADLFQPTEPPRGKLPQTLQAQTLSLLGDLLLNIIDSAPTAPAEELMTNLAVAAIESGEERLVGAAFEDSRSVAASLGEMV